jgi:predicted AlkP superfamily pyrophosphatase or phosphodiesterase
MNKRMTIFAISLWLFTPILAIAQSSNRTVVVISLDGFPAYVLKDPLLPVPTLRRLMAEGAYADSMRPINPTVTWPNHTAMVTGVNAIQHQVLFNGLLSVTDPPQPPKIEPWHPKELMVHSPTVYDIAFQAGMITAQVDWVAIYEAKTITWQFAEKPDPEGKIESELVAAGVVTKEQLRSFAEQNSAWQDRIWTAAAVDILEKHAPNLLLVHFLALDSTNHEFGPGSGASYTAMAFLDDRVKQILDAIEKSGRANLTTVFIVSDHGFRGVQHEIHPDALLRRKGFAKASRGSVWVIPDGGVAMVYITDPAQRTTLLPQLRTLFDNLEGIAHVYDASEFASLGLPARAQSDQAPDLLLSAKQDYLFGDATTGGVITPSKDRGAHGYLSDDPSMQAIFIASGAGIKKGVRLPQISNVDVAPTIAALLGLDMKNASGHTIREILEAPGVH